MGENIVFSVVTFAPEDTIADIGVEVWVFFIIIGWDCFAFFELGVEAALCIY